MVTGILGVHPEIDLLFASYFFFVETFCVFCVRWLRCHCWEISSSPVSCVFWWHPGRNSDLYAPNKKTTSITDYPGLVPQIIPRHFFLANLERSFSMKIHCISKVSPRLLWVLPTHNFCYFPNPLGFCFCFQRHCLWRKFHGEMSGSTD